MHERKEVDTPIGGERLLLDKHSARQSKDLVHADGGECVGFLGIVNPDKRFRIDKFSLKNHQDLTDAWLTVADDLCVIKIELGLAIAPVTIVLEQRRCELRDGAFHKRQKYYD